MRSNIQLQRFQAFADIEPDVDLIHTAHFNNVVVKIQRSEDHLEKKKESSPSLGQTLRTLVIMPESSPFFAEKRESTEGRLNESNFYSFERSSAEFATNALLRDE